MIKNSSTSCSAATKPKFGKRQEIGPEEHGIDPTLVDERALNVVHTLKEAGHEAYIVGGAVRDLLLGLRPKDFDVATSATPEQVKGLFRRAFIIGRRFRIVHVVYGRGREHEVIEVSTFRAYMDNAAAERSAGNEKHQQERAGGHEARRGFQPAGCCATTSGARRRRTRRAATSPSTRCTTTRAQTVVDYHGGIKDAKKQEVLRMIGDPAARYREDPVRIIRAVRFAAKLARWASSSSPRRAPLLPSLSLLADVPQSRLFDEMLKLLQTGHSLATIEQLKFLGLARGIYPLLDLVVERADQPFVRAALQDTDRRVGEGKPVAPSFLLACVLWADVRDGWAASAGAPAASVPGAAGRDRRRVRIAHRRHLGPRQAGADMREIWMMQPRFEKRMGSTPFSLVEQPRFRAAFDFMRLRADIGEVDVVLADWWQEFSCCFTAAAVLILSA
jgi:poly(A) polymerase